jgi:hypothetical protein
MLLVLISILIYKCNTCFCLTIFSSNVTL